MLAIALILLGVASRFLIHFDNFTPILAIAIFAGAVLPRKQALIVPLLTYVISDLFVGLHSLIIFTWGAMLLAVLVGKSIKGNRNWTNVAGASLVSALIFFVITNFAVWLMYPTYAKSASGLLQCYVAAIPYFRNTLISTFAYSFALFALYDIVKAQVKNTAYAYIAK